MSIAAVVIRSGLGSGRNIIIIIIISEGHDIISSYGLMMMAGEGEDVQVFVIRDDDFLPPFLLLVRASQGLSNHKYKHSYPYTS